MSTPQFPLDPSLASLIISSYEGERQNNVFHGHGTATFINGQVYTGSFVGGRMHGHGVLQWPDGVSYDGDFEYNEITGQGRYKWPDESWYEGEVRCGKRHGMGYFQCSNRITSYDGNWVDGYQHGYGKLIYDEYNNIVYEGDWEFGQRHGKGTMKYASGNVYEGEWKHGKKCGHGTMHWFDKAETFEGDWVNDQQHGHGVHIWKTIEKRGNRYDGEFANGVRDGYGIFYYANGARYEGHWEDNVKNGLGLFFFEDGTIYEGEFVRDRMVDMNDNKAKNSETIPTMVLYIDDIIRGDDKEKARAMKAVQHAVLRANTDLRNVYRHYASCAGTSVPNAATENNILMEMRELWRFSAECRLNVSMGKLNRYLLTVRNAQNKAVKKLRIQREKKRRQINARTIDAIETHREKWVDIHDPDRVLLFREFCEILVRIAWDDALERGDINLSVADAFTHLYDDKIHDHASTPMEPMEALEISVHSLEMQTVFQKNQELLEKLFFKYSGSTTSPENDIHISTRNFILMLRDANGLGTLGVSGVLKCLRKSFETESHEKLDPFMLDADMIYPEFLEALTKVALAVTPRNLPMPVLVAQYIRDTFERDIRKTTSNRRLTMVSKK
ncbi:radial spoke head 10 family protein [Thraustotheca clavata]|uniref:Radial spoke head 10 family protein n=1 Tax=Thraustotheca clavata TaxID=74557 RepID=A0A1W0A1R0_9STRA|nr:radial spoke head 10 family protein [Thraustotheca clavata]